MVQKNKQDFEYKQQIMDQHYKELLLERQKTLQKEEE